MAKKKKEVWTPDASNSRSAATEYLREFRKKRAENPHYVEKPSIADWTYRASQAEAFRQNAPSMLSMNAETTRRMQEASPLYSLARRTVEDRERDFQRQAAKTLGLSGAPVTDKGLQKEINRANYDYMRLKGTGFNTGLRKNFAENPSVRSKIKDFARDEAERKQKEQEERIRSINKRAGDRKDTYVQLNKREPIADRSVDPRTEYRQRPSQPRHQYTQEEGQKLIADYLKEHPGEESSQGIRNTNAMEMMQVRENALQYLMEQEKERRRAEALNSLRRRTGGEKDISDAAITNVNQGDIGRKSFAERAKEYLRHDPSGSPTANFGDVLYPSLRSTGNPMEQDLDKKFGIDRMGERNLSAFAAAGRTSENNPLMAAEQASQGAPIQADRAQSYIMMTRKEKQNYNAILARDGLAKAEEYHDALMDDINKRIAQRNYLEGTKDAGTIPNALYTLSAGLGQGLRGVGELGNLALGTSNTKATPVSEYLAEDIRTNEDNTAVQNAIYDIAQSTGNMIPGIVTSAFLGPQAGSAVFAFSQAGNAYRDAINAGETTSTASLYGLQQGVDEMATNFLLGGIGAFGGGEIKRIIQEVGGDAFTRALDRVVKTPAGRQILNRVMDYVSNMGSEAAQEYVQFFTENWTQAFLGMKDKDGNPVAANFNPLDPNALYAALLGGLNAGVLNVPQIASRTAMASRMDTSDAQQVADYINKDLDISAFNEEDLDKAIRLADISQDIQAKQEKGIKPSLIDKAAYASATEDLLSSDSVRETRENNWKEMEKQDIENLSGAFFGENGKQAFESEIAPENRIGAYRTFVAYYNHGYSGAQIPTEIERNAHDVMSTDQISAALRAGALDHQANFPNAELKTVEDSVSNIKIEGTKEGRIDKSRLNENLLTSQQRFRVRYASALISKTLGIDVEFFQSVVGMDGKFYDPDKVKEGVWKEAKNGAFYVSAEGRPTIRLDVNAGMLRNSDWTGELGDIKTMLPIISHELTHYLEKFAPQMYEELSNMVINNLIANKSYGAGLDFNTIVERQRRKMEEDEQREITNDYVLREMVARACEDMLSGNEDAVKAFEKVNNKTKRYIWNHIKKVFENIEEFFRQMLGTYRSGSAEAQIIRQNMEEFEKIRAKWQEALGFATENQNEGTPLEVQYSLRQFDDGKKFVEIDQNQDEFDGKPEEEWPKIAKRILTEKFQGKVIGTENTAFFSGESRNEYVYPSNRRDGTFRSEKMRAAPEIDNLLDAGVPLPGAEDGRDGHKHKGAIGGFDYYQTLFKIGNRYFEGTINVENMKRGAKFKDITKIKDVTKDTMSSYGQNPKSQFLRTSSIKEIISHEESKHQEKIDKKSLKNGVARDGVTLSGKNGTQFSERTYENGGREFLKMWLETQSDLSKEDREDVVYQIDRVYDIMQKAKAEGGLEGYTAWSNVENRDGQLTVIVPNGEYPLNIDFSTVCKKRKALDHILNTMIRSDQLTAADLAGKDIVRLQQIIKSEGLEIACALCFVDSKRYRIGDWAERITAGKDTGKSHQYGFNELLDSLIPKGSNIKIDEHNFTGRKIKQPKGNLLKNAPDSQLDFSLVDKLIANSNKSSWNYKVAMTIRENPDARSYLNSAELLSSIGFDPIKVKSPAIYSLINNAGGSSKPKLSFSEVPYLNDILMNQQMTPEQAYKVGGVRIQSFSDFMANMVFDYVQMVGELQAKKLPAHAYTKEASFVALFGKTGIKINMSLVPKATTMTQEDIRKYVTQFDTKKKRQKAYNELKSRAGLDENGNYLWEDETFPYEVAMHFQADPEYAKNCGTIAVGVSDAHIRKLLMDPTIQMVIPYHTSGINNTVAKMRGIDLYTDYTKQQTTKNRATGKSITASQNTFDFYKVLQETGDPKKTADEYLKWCKENNFIPKFEKFTKGPGAENYYKLLIDFRVYDENGNYAPQGAVQAVYPEESLMKEYILNGYTYTAEDGTVYKNGGLRAAQETSDKLAAKTEEIIRRYNAGETGNEDVEEKMQNSSRDSDGNMVSEAQKEYFKDSQVRDAEGNLIPVYHGTNAEFNEFSKDFIGSHGSFEGAGFNFTPSRTRAGGYKNIGENAGRVMEGYLNITKPLSDSKKTMSARNLASLIRSIDPTGDNIISNYARDTRDYGKQSFITRESLTTARAIFDFADSDVDIYSELSAAGADPKTIIEAFEKLGYDGLIHHADNGDIKTLIAFESNQFKNRDNMNPTENADIRYSSRDSDGNELTEGQQEYFANSKVRDRKGNLVKVYHGGTVENVFDTGRGAGGDTEFGPGAYFTDSEYYAKEYTEYRGGKVKEYYINLTNPYDNRKKFEDGPEWDKVKGILTERYGINDKDLRLIKNWGMKTMQEVIDRYTGTKQRGFFTNVNEANAILREAGYDGVIAEYNDVLQYVVFNPNQAKLTTNQNPTENVDIRYASRDVDAFDLWQEVVAERNDEEGRDSVFFLDDDDSTKVTYQQQEFMEELSKNSDTVMAMNAALHQAIGEGKQVDVAKFAAEQARKLRTEYGSKIKKADLQDAIESLCKKMNKAVQKDANDIAIAASNIGREVMDGVMYVDDTMKQMYPNLQREIKSYRLAPSSTARGDMAAAYDSYESFRRRAFGRLTLVNEESSNFIRVDSAYQELSEKYPDLFPADTINESEQLLRILEVANDLSGVRVKGVEALGMAGSEIDAQAYMIGQDILGDFYRAAGQPAFGGVLETVRDDLKTRYHEEIRELRYRKNAKIAELQSRIAELEADNDELLAKEREKLHTEKIEALIRQQQRNQEEIEKLRKEMLGEKNKALSSRQLIYNRLLTKMEQKKLNREARARLLSQARILARMKGGPDFEARKAELIGQLDLISTGMRSDTRAKLEEFRTRAQKLAAEDENYAGLSYKAAEAVFSRLSKKHISTMTGKDIADLTEKIVELIHMEQDSKRMLNKEIGIQVSTVAKTGMDQQKRAKGINERNALGAAIGKYTLNMLNPTRAMAMLDGYAPDGVLKKLGDALNDGQTKMNDFIMKSNKKFDGFLEKHRELADTWYVNDIDTGLKDKDGKPIYINKGMRISLYLHSLNNQNMNHIAGAGISIPDAEMYRKGKYSIAYRYSQNVRLMPTDIKEITSHMTEDEKAFAELARTFLNKDTKDAINETSMVLNGTLKAGVDNYFPIRTDTDFVMRDVTGLIQDATIEGMGMLKERVMGAKTPILLEDVAVVIQRQTQNTARYYGLAIPVRDFNKIFKWKKSAYVNDYKEDGTKKTVYEKLGENPQLGAEPEGFRKSIRRTWGDPGIKYIEGVLKDIQTGGHGEEGPGARMFSSLKSTYAGTVLNWNLGVSIKQSASAPFAAVVLDAKSVAKAFAGTNFFKPADLEYMDSITPWSYMRREGSSGTEMGEVYKQKNMIQKSGKVQWLKNHTNFIQAVDVWTTNRLFLATEYYVQDHFPKLEKRGPEYNQKVAELYNDMLQRTQPSYDVMQRNAFLRSDSPATKVFGMFKTQTFNMGAEVIDAWGRLTAYNKMHKDKLVSDDQLKRVRGQFGKTVGATIVSQLMLTALGVLAKAVYHNMKNYRDDEGRVTPESIIGRAIYEFLTSFSGMTMGGAEVQSIMLAVTGAEKWYDMEYPGLSSINDMITNATKMTEAYRKAAENEWEPDKAEAFKKSCIEFAMSAAILGRIPADNLYKIGNAFYLHVQDIKAGKPGSFESGDSLFGLRDSNVTKDQYANRAAAAYKAGDTEAGDKWSEKTTEKKLQKAMYGDQGIDEDSSKAMVEYVKAGGDAADFEKGKSLGKELEEKDIKGDEVYAYVVDSKDYSNQEKIAWFKSSTTRAESKKYTAWKNAGYGDWDFLKYRSDLSKFSGDGKQEKIVNYIKTQTTDTKKRKALWLLAGYKESSFDKNMN